MALASVASSFPDHRHYGRISNLLIVLKFNAQAFVASSSTIMQIVQILNRGEGLGERHLKALGGALGQLMRECGKLELPMVNALLSRIKAELDSGQDLNVRAMQQQIHELTSRLYDELATSVIYQLEPLKAKQYETPEGFWGSDISRAFPSAMADLVDASKCYGLDRDTAAVFHAMRALEIALGCMARVFAVPADHTNWHNIIEQIEAKVRDLSKTKPKNWKQDQEFYSQAASYFLVIKDAWRNYTAHARGRYDSDEAFRVMNNVCGFMKKLAERLHE